MTPEEIDAWLAHTLDDRRFSRPERQAMGGLMAGPGPVPDRQVIRGRAFEIARDALANPADRSVLEWLEEVVKALREEDRGDADRPMAEAHFSPGDDCPRAIVRLLSRARLSVDACVFTITDDRLSDALIAAHARGVAVRVVTDDAKADDLGSDAGRFGRAGIPVRVDRSAYHMHHKFAIFDRATLLTGSYNWTRGAANDNEENLIVTDDPRLIAPFGATFEHLWEKFA